MDRQIPTGAKDAIGRQISKAEAERAQLQGALHTFHEHANDNTDALADTVRYLFDAAKENLASVGTPEAHNRFVEEVVGPMELVNGKPRKKELPPAETEGSDSKGRLSRPVAGARSLLGRVGLTPLAQHVAVAHPGKLRLIYGSKHKNDRVDAQKLAKLLLLDMVPPVGVPSIDVRAWQSLIVRRQRVMSQVVRAKNQIRAVLRENDITGAKWLWSKKKLAWLESLELHPIAKLRLDLAVEEFRSLDQNIKRLEAELQKYADRHPAVALLVTIPGVGIRTAETFVAWVDDIARFRNNRQLGAYFGLVPCQDASADKNRLGHKTFSLSPVRRGRRDATNPTARSSSTPPPAAA